MTGGDMSETPPWLKKDPPQQTVNKKFPLKVIPMAKSTKDNKATLRETYRSGFFYIEGCFYNDMR